MRVKSGAGASVSSGASYQARVGAYVIVCQMCNADTGTDIALAEAVRKISFETMEEVDDINVLLKNGSTIYIQAKATISFSIAPKGELRSVLDQFQRQRCRDGDRLLLITTSRASKRIVYDLRSAFDAYRHAEEWAFYKTQPKAVTATIDEVKATLRELGYSGDVAALIKLMSVIVLDVEADEPLEQALVLTMQSCNFIAPRAVWGKLIADCMNYSKSRHTVEFEEIEKSYERFRSEEKAVEEEATAELMRFEIGRDISAGREVVLCESDGEILPEGLNLIEFYRFDSECNERIRFDGEKVILGDGRTLKILRRAATYEGMTRLIERDSNLAKGKEIHLIPANRLDNVDESPCALVQRERIEKAISQNDQPMSCLHCGKPVFSSAAHVVELSPHHAPIVGLTHDGCLLPVDRVLGMVKNEFFEKHSELIDFDVVGWFKAIHGGQMAFVNAKHVANSQAAYILWANEEVGEPLGNYVVEVSLINGEREIVTRRNGVHRFSKLRADDFAKQLNIHFAEARANRDPFCYSDQSKAFGYKSKLLEMLGAKEKLRPVDHARSRIYDATFAKQFSRVGQWYAPLLYLRNAETDETISLQNSVFMLTDPLSLEDFLENWAEAQVYSGDYRTEVILTDVEFDSFMRWNEARGYSAIVDPLFDPSNQSLISGHPVMSEELLKQQI